MEVDVREATGGCSCSGELPGGLILTGRYHDAVSPLALSDIQRPVRRVDQLQSVVGIDGIGGDPDGYGELAARLSFSAMEGMLRDLDADLLRNARSGLPIDLGEQDHELFPAKARHHIRPAGVGKQNLPALPQHLVPEEVTVRIVVVFELVKIQHEDGEGAAVAPSALDLCLEALEEMSSVEESCELVARAQLFGPLVELRVLQGHGDLVGHGLKLIDIATRERLGLRLVRVQHTDNRPPLDLQRDAEKRSVRGETDALHETRLGADVGHQHGIAALGDQARDPFTKTQGKSVGTLFRQAKSGSDYEPAARLVQQEQRIGVDL